MIKLAINIVPSSNDAVPCLNTVFFHKTGTHVGIIVTLMSMAETTDGSDGVHIEANLAIGRLGVLGQIDGRLQRDVR